MKILVYPCDLKCSSNLWVLLRQSTIIVAICLASFSCISTDLRAQDSRPDKGSDGQREELNFKSAFEFPNNLHSYAEKEWEKLREEYKELTKRLGATVDSST